MTAGRKLPILSAVESSRHSAALQSCPNRLFSCSRKTYDFPHILLIIDNSDPQKGLINTTIAIPRSQSSVFSFIGGF